MGRGTFGRVYIAIDKVTNRAVAVQRQSVPSEAASREFAAHSMLRGFPSPHILMTMMLDYFIDH
jgi:serine/threonine protein kinase